MDIPFRFTFYNHFKHQQKHMTFVHCDIGVILQRLPHLCPSPIHHQLELLACDQHMHSQYVLHPSQDRPEQSPFTLQVDPTVPNRVIA
jgi:hypothetical protein